MSSLSVPVFCNTPPRVMRAEHLHAERCLDMHSKGARRIVNRGRVRIVNIIVHLPKSDRARARAPPFLAYHLYLSQNIKYTDRFVNIIWSVNRVKALKIFIAPCFDQFKFAFFFNKNFLDEKRHVSARLLNFQHETRAFVTGY